MKLNDAEQFVISFLSGRLKKENTISLVGERSENSPLKEELEKAGYVVTEVYTAQNPMNNNTNFNSSIVVGVRPCDWEGNYKYHDLTPIFMNAVRKTNRYFVLIPCGCEHLGMKYKEKIPYFIRRYSYIESIQCFGYNIMFHNLDTKVLFYS